MTTSLQDKILSYIDITKLSRNFIETPIEGYEVILENDLIYLYKEINLGLSLLAIFFGCSKDKITKYLKKYNLTKNKQEKVASRTLTCLIKYNCNNVMQCDNIKEKYQQNLYNKTGFISPLANPTIQDKCKDIIKDKYGVDNIQQNKDIRNKTETTILDKYGNKTIFGSSYFKEKVKETWMESLGVDNPSKSDVMWENYKKNCMEKYGTEFPYEKIKQTTKLNKNSKTKSKEEDDIFLILQSKFPDTIHNGFDERYKHPIKGYKYEYDFYIPSLDLFIEYQGYVTHGDKPFNPNDPDCIKKLNKWNNKLEMYKNINSKKSRYELYKRIWTIGDPLKRKVAQENNLNWIEFFSFNQFLQWFETL